MCLNFKCKHVTSRKYTYPGADPSRWAGRGWPGIHSALIMNRDVVPLALTNDIGNAVANFDLEDERTDGCTAAMLQLIKALDAISIFITLKMVY